jgi:hypothetical protein
VYKCNKSSHPMQNPPISHVHSLHVAMYIYIYIQGVPGERVNILGGHNTGDSKQKYMYLYVFFSKRFPR